VVCIALVIQCALSIGVLAFQQQSIRGVFDRELEAEAALLAASVASDAPDWEPSRLFGAMTDRAQSLVFGGVSLAVLDRNGAPVVTSADPARLRLDTVIEALRSEGAPGVRFTSINLVDEGGWRRRWHGWRRVVAIPFTGADGQPYRLFVYASDRRPREMLRLVTMLLLLGLPIGAGAAGAGGWFVAGIAVRPLGQIRRAAQSISPESLGEVVELRTDHTEVFRLQQELNKALRRIEEGYQIQERFLANVSHELKTPISVLLMEAQTLPAQGLEGPARAFVDSVIDEMQRLGRMIEGFLILTRVRETKVRTEKRPELVNEFVSNAVAFCGPKAASYGVGVRITMLHEEEALDLCVLGHAELLRIMVENLVRNAIRFSPEGGTVHVEVGIDDAEVCITVSDEGPGIPGELIGRVFDRYAQAPSERANNRGAGLGLEIAKSVAEMHGGCIWATNNAGGGARFTIMLPVHDDDAPQTHDQTDAAGGAEEL